MWTSTDLDNNRILLRDLLDPLLVAERSGWPRGTRVRVVGVPTTVQVGPDRMIDYGHQALVHAPSWVGDPQWHTLRPGPPTGYRLAYHVAGAPPEHSSISLEATPVEHLELDVDHGDNQPAIP